MRVNDVTTTFEGPEKKLDIVLFSPGADLRAWPDSRWSRVVKTSRSHIVSKISSDYLDAYILSESSLFVWADRVLMMTCGQTTLTKALPEILHIVGKQNVARVFYERKNFLFPLQQLSNFQDDVAGIMNFFPGKSERFGPVNDDHVHLFYASHTSATSKREATLQLLMHELEPSLMEIFSSSDNSAEDTAGKRLELDRIYPHLVTDSHLFSPCGYSMNGILEKNYVTIHVTPQPEGSYASFETDIVDNDYSGKIKQVVSIFEPGKLSLVLRTSLDDLYPVLHSTVKVDLPGYCATDCCQHQLDCGYAVTFLNYSINSNRNVKLR